MKQLIIILIVSFSFTKVSSQVVNIESRRLQTDSVRFVSVNELSSFYNDNDGLSLFSLAVSSTTQFKSKNLQNIGLLIGSYNFITSRKVEFQNSWLLHARVNHKFNRVFGGELFAQSQRNNVLDVNERHFIGIGIRLKVISKKHLNVYFGESYMYEKEINNEFSLSRLNHRNSSYLSFTANILENKLEILNTIYFQPKYDDISEFNLLEQFKVNIQIANKVSVFLLFDYLIDNNTPLNRKQYNFDSKMGISLNI